VRDIDRWAVSVVVGRELHPVAAHLKLDEDRVEGVRCASNRRLSDEGVEQVLLARRQVAGPL